MKAASKKPEDCFNETCDVLDAGRDLRKMMRELELSLATNSMLRTGAHRAMKRYFRLWDVLEKELEVTRAAAERRSTIQRLGGR